MSWQKITSTFSILIKKEEEEINDQYISSELIFNKLLLNSQWLYLFLICPFTC